MTRTLVILPATALMACGGGGIAAPMLDAYPEAKLDSEDAARGWAMESSAPNVYLKSTQPLGIVGLNGIATNSDPACPRRTQEGNTLRIEGNCTDSEGRVWLGSAVRESEAAGSTTGKLRYSAFGFEETSDCNGAPVPSRSVFHGIVEVRGTQQNLTFEADVKTELEGPDDACVSTSGSAAWDYSGRLTTDGNNRQKWSGKGRVGSSEAGIVSAETNDEVVDGSTCDSEASSGTTTMTSAGSTVVVTYNGAVDCDSAPAAEWSLNGHAQGELVGVSCTAAPALIRWLPALAGLALMRRRRRAVPQRQ